MTNPRLTTVLAPAKINLFLHITGQRADGYHTLQSVFQLLDFYDTIQIEVSSDPIITRVNQHAAIPEAQDLAVRAARALQLATHCRLGCRLTIQKNIPMGAGLGGGSSDAASVLIALNQLWQLGLSREQLMTIGLSLGADVPFFIFGQNAWVEGIGEILQPISLTLPYFVVLTPAVHVSTAEIFANSGLTKGSKPLKIADFSAGTNAHAFRNDLQGTVCNVFPAVASALSWLGQFGPARMSGSGASVFVAVDSQTKAMDILAQKPDNITGFVAKGLSRHPLFSVID